MAVSFSSFDDALDHLPLFIGGIDLVGQHFTIADLRFRVQHEIDLYVEGEENEIVCRRQSDTSTRYRKCKAFIARCDASL